MKRGFTVFMAICAIGLSGCVSTTTHTASNVSGNTAPATPAQENRTTDVSRNTAPATPAQENTVTEQERFPDLNLYADVFAKAFGFDDWRRAELRVTDPTELNDLFAVLGGNNQFIDTPLEMALAIYFTYTAEGLDNNEELEAILPHSNPRLVDRQLGAYVYKEMQILRFLGDSAGLARHEAVLHFITERGNATQAQIQAFYRQNIAAHVSSLVDEQFAELRATRSTFNVPAARLVEVKRAITDFMLSPSTASYAELLATYRRNTGETALTLIYTIDQINSEVSSALGNNRIIGSN